MVNFSGSRGCKERVHDARWRRVDKILRRRRNLGIDRSWWSCNWSSQGRGDDYRNIGTVGCDCSVGSAHVRATAVTASVDIAVGVVAAGCHDVAVGRDSRHCREGACYVNCTKSSLPRFSKGVIPRETHAGI